MSRDSQNTIHTAPLFSYAMPSQAQCVWPVPHMTKYPVTGSPAGPATVMQDDSGKDDDEQGTGTGLATRTRTKPKKPSLYRVLLLNDDFTPMEFVILVLERFFSKNRAQATRIMLHVHNHGVGECGTFTYEVAETKVTQVMDFARKHQHPLQCVLEKK